MSRCPSPATTILALTWTGATAARMAHYRPTNPINAITPSRSVRRHLTLFAGVRFLRADSEGNAEAQIHYLEKAVLEAGFLTGGRPGDHYHGQPLATHGTTNLMKAHLLGSSPHCQLD